MDQETCNELDALRAELAEMRELLDYTSGAGIAVRSAVSAAMVLGFSRAQRLKVARALRLTATELGKQSSRYAPAAVATLIAIATAAEEPD